MDYHVYVLIVALVITDYLTGITAGCITDGFSSTKMREGLLHKLTYFVAILVCLCIEGLGKYLDLGFVMGSSITTLVCIWICVTEIGSILENMCIINPEMADNAFLQLFENKNKQGK